MTQEQAAAHTGWGKTHFKEVRFARFAHWAARQPACAGSGSGSSRGSGSGRPPALGLRMRACELPAARSTPVPRRTGWLRRS